MSLLRRPDWTEPMATGLWGLGYRLQGDLGLVLLAGGTTLPSENPDRLWPFILTDHQRRNKAVEQSVAKEQDFSAYLENQILGKEAILCVREKHFDKLLCLLETELVAHHRPGK